MKRVIGVVSYRSISDESALKAYGALALPAVESFLAGESFKSVYEEFGGDPRSAKIDAVQVLFASTDGQRIDGIAGYVMCHVRARRTIVSRAVIVILECAAVAINIQCIVTQAIGH
jgi:hypothetical protein